MPSSPDSPERIEGMVQGIRAGGFLFLSAIRGRNPHGEVAFDEDPVAQAQQAFRNLESVLAASGATLRNVVKVTLYLHDLQMRVPFHQVWLEKFPTAPPARIAVCVKDANAVPGGKAHFALDVIAIAP
jgi:2-iminobutanoate/2-iminopropanoate deaminase